MHERLAVGRRLTAIEFLKAQRARERIRAEQWAVFDRVDVLVTPTVPSTAARVGADSVEINGQTYPLPDQLTRFTYPFNLSGFPAMSIPCGFDRAGLPIGLQLVAPPWHEALLVRVGHAYQQATRWHTDRPALQPAVERKG
jgi:Asp-tRNA(Asn)/Glu-tRNA(Gln) amidotransferase A subunit family amidase